MNRLVRRKKILWAWALTASDRKTFTIRVLLWWLPWVGITMLAFLNFTFLTAIAFALVTLFSCGSFWLLGYIRAARRGVRNVAETYADCLGEHPDLVEFDLKRVMRKQAAQR